MGYKKKKKEEEEYEFIYDCENETKSRSFTLEEIATGGALRKMRKDKMTEVTAIKKRQREKK